jgi:hypothetical protein
VDSKAIISVLRSYLFSYFHCFSDFYTGYEEDFKAVNLGVKIQKEQEEKNRKAKDYGYRRSLRFQFAK